MQKNKIATICFIIGIGVYVLLGDFLIFKLSSAVFTNIINPLFWTSLAIILYKLLGKNIENKKLIKETIEYTLIACIVYILVFLFSGLFVTFGRNPFVTTIKGFILNLWRFGAVIIAREYVRYRLVNNVQNKDKLLIGILSSIVIIFIDFNIFKKFTVPGITTYYVFAQIFRNLLPLIAVNALCTYLAINNNFKSAVTYCFVTKLFEWITPIWPNSPWIMDSFIKTMIPVILLLYIRYMRNKLDRFRTREKILNSDPRSIIPLVALIILAVWFALGIFPIKPISIASGSMESALYIGDVAIIKKCKSNDINVGDIIEYKSDNVTIVHRVVEKFQTKGEVYFRTKGDHNTTTDSKIVNEGQLVGKVIFKVRYIGYPAIWLHLIRQQETLEN